MKQRLLIAFLTIVVFGAGYFGGVWTERHSCKVPPPPPRLLSELSSKPNAGNVAKQPAPAPNVADLANQIAKLRPQIDAFRARMEEIDREMDQDIDTILTPQQHQTFQGMIRYYADVRAKEDADLTRPVPLTPQEITELQQKPLYKMLAIVVVPMRLEWNARELKLDEEQREKLRHVLEARRAKFLALVDSLPPPTLGLSRLAAAAERLRQQQEAAAQAAAGK
jgi:hypothetical protein